MGSTTNVVTLLESVERLPEQDQDLLLKLVRLLIAAPEAAQKHAIRMLGDVIAMQPETRFECVSDLREIVEFLDARVEAKHGRRWRATDASRPVVSIIPEPNS